MIIYGTALSGNAVKSEYAPGDVVGFRAAAEDEHVILRWQDPQDTVFNNVVFARWAGTKIVRKEGDYPENESDGVVVVDNTVRGQYQADGFVDAGLLNGVTYYYQAFPYDYAGRVLKEHNSQGDCIQFEYDALGSKTKFVDSIGGNTAIPYGTTYDTKRF